MKEKKIWPKKAVIIMIAMMIQKSLEIDNKILGNEEEDNQMITLNRSEQEKYLFDHKKPRKLYSVSILPSSGNAYEMNQSIFTI